MLKRRASRGTKGREEMLERVGGGWPTQISVRLRPLAGLDPRIVGDLVKAKVKTSEAAITIYSISFTLTLFSIIDANAVMKCCDTVTLWVVTASCIACDAVLQLVSTRIQSLGVGL
ncbi:hypothetical protein Tco_0514984 [Tanacetum coccineum]